MHNGLEIKLDEQQQLLNHARAVTNPLPDELNPVASAVKISPSLSNVPVFLPDVPTNESASEEELTPLEEVDLRSVDSGSVSPYIENVSAIASIPIQEDGTVLNPRAYKEWKLTPIEDGLASSVQWQEKLTAFTQRLSMCDRQPERSKPTESLDELEELNRWLSDPILKPEVLSRVMRSDRYKVEFDEDGKPCRVTEVVAPLASVESYLSKNTD
ncbi:MAG: hypothetical protein HC820_10070 [Hydrococcus sp. RM1_1_31]|nr:hypothetical protein [Hydrococcus sp. RM1_1_31]